MDITCSTGCREYFRVPSGVNEDESRVPRSPILYDLVTMVTCTLPVLPLLYDIYPPCNKVCDVVLAGVIVSTNEITNASILDQLYSNNSILI